MSSTPSHLDDRHRADTPIIPLKQQAGQLIYVEADGIERVLKQEQERDALLGISRTQIPVQIIPCPDSPIGLDWQQKVEQIDRIATIKFRAENPDQAAMLRCFQFKWRVRALWLANEICDRPVPNLVDQYLRSMAPHRALEELSWEVPYDLALYKLIQSGEVDIRDWCIEEGIDYPFSTAFDLFLKILEQEFLQIQEYCFEITPSVTNKRARIKEHRQWTAFLVDRWEDEQTPKECINNLRQSGWLGYVILALWTGNRKPSLKHLRKGFINAHKQLIKLIDYQMRWKDGFPTQGGQTSQRILLKSHIADDGYFDWYLESPPSS